MQSSSTLNTAVALLTLNKNPFHMKINGPHFRGPVKIRLQSWGPQFGILVLLQNCCMNSTSHKVKISKAFYVSVNY